MRMSAQASNSPFPSYLVGVALGLDSLNLKINQIKVPETTAPITNATVIILKNRFQISTLLSRYSPGSSTPNANCRLGKIIKTDNTMNSPIILLIAGCFVVHPIFYLRVLKVFND